MRSLSWGLETPPDAREGRREGVRWIRRKDRRHWIGVYGGKESRNMENRGFKSGIKTDGDM